MTPDLVHHLLCGRLGLGSVKHCRVRVSGAVSLEEELETEGGSGRH